MTQHSPFVSESVSIRFRLCSVLVSTWFRLGFGSDSDLGSIRFERRFDLKSVSNLLASNSISVRFGFDFGTVRIRFRFASDLISVRFGFGFASLRISCRFAR